jgi:hypothetical protein
MNDFVETPTRPNADTPTRFPTDPFPHRPNSPCVGIVRVFYRMLPLHKGMIADYNL